MPRATTQQDSAKSTPSTINATRSTSERSAESISVRATSVRATKRRDTDDFDVDVATASTVEPTGSRPAGYRLVESLAIIRSRASSPRSSVEANNS
jgi:hypothetical protein